VAGEGRRSTSGAVEPGPPRLLDRRLAVVSGGRRREQEWETVCRDPFRQAVIEFVFDPMTDEHHIRQQRCELLAGEDVDPHVGAGDDGCWLADPPEDRHLAEVSAGTDLVDRLTVPPDLGDSAYHDHERLPSLTLTQEHASSPKAEPSCGA
jgi:hypothetical protein